MSERSPLLVALRPAFVYLILLIAIMAACFIGMGAMYWPVFQLENQVDAYAGDGAIAMTSRSLTTHGYRIDFNSFDLSIPLEVSYSLTGLPRIDRSARIGLYFDEISDEVYAIRGGTLMIEVLAGDTVLSTVSEPLDDWNFSDQVGIFVTYYDYQTGARSGFDLDDLPEGVSPELRVTLTPPEGVDPDLRGRVRVQVGGYY